MCSYSFDTLPLKIVIHPTKSQYICHNSAAVFSHFELLVKSLKPETYPELTSASKMESFAAIVND